MKFSTVELAELTGINKNTVGLRLKSIEPELRGRSKIYDSKDALPVIYGLTNEKRLDPTQERAQLDKERRLVVEMQRKQQEGLLIPQQDVIDEWVNQITIAKGRLLALPSRVSASILNAKSQALIEDKLRQAITEILEELSNEGRKDGRETNGLSVGQQEQRLIYEED